MKRLIIGAAVLAQSGCALMAQHYVFPADAQGRGYTDRPYLRYEAEPDYCKAYTGDMLLPPVPFSQQPLQAEASRQTCLTLGSKGDFVEWTNDAEADGLSLRFSIPDSSDGKGLKSTLALYAGSEKLADIELDSFWAWQYATIANTSEKYSDNEPSDLKFARMRFDEVYALLPRSIKEGETIRLVKEADDGIPCTVDFIELEKVPAPVTFESIEGDKVKYEGTGSDLASFINNNAGKTIYIPEGHYSTARRLIISADNTRIVGAGMWYTTIYFSATSDNQRTYMQHGIESNSSNLLFEGFSLNTANNIRYFKNNPSFQTGKGFQGSLGSGTIIRNVRVDHFECGAWIADYSGQACDNLLVENSRFRNNYADGINLCSGTKNATVRQCSFRNNGDDDMASWSSGHATENIGYEHCTGENNWRASSLGFFGGKNLHATDIFIADALEEGARANGEFQNTGFEGTTTFERITLERCGDRGGTPGINGGFWGSECAAFRIHGGYYTDVKNIKMHNIDILESRNNAIVIDGGNNKKVENLELYKITVDGVGNYKYGIYVAPGTHGNGTYCDLTFRNCVEPALENAAPNTFTFIEKGPAGIGGLEASEVRIGKSGNSVVARGLRPGEYLRVYAADGIEIGNAVADADGKAEVPVIYQGIFVAKSDTTNITIRF